MTKKVLITGATGRTGSLVLKKLRQESEQFHAMGFARTQSKVLELFGSTEGFFFGDITDRSSLEPALKDCSALVILTSAVPKMKVPPLPGERPQFEYEPDAMPEKSLNQLSWE